MSRIAQVATMVASLLLLGPAPSVGAPDPVEVAPHHVPRTEMAAAAWIDRDRQVLHLDGGRARIEPPIRGRLIVARRVADGVVVQVGRHRLVHVSKAGAPTLLTRELDPYSGWAVEPSGGRLAYGTADDQEYVVVVDLSGAEIARRAVDFANVLAFSEGVVWCLVPVDDPLGLSVAGTWDLATNVLSPARPRLRSAVGVDVRAGVAYRFSVQRPRRFDVVPLDRSAAWDRWTLHDEFPWGFSPDGRYLVTVGPVRIREVLDRGSRAVMEEATWARVRRTTTGRLVRSFVGPLTGRLVWEDAASFVVAGRRPDGDVASLRLTLDGRVTRVSAFDDRRPRHLLVE